MIFSSVDKVSQTWNWQSGPLPRLWSMLMSRQLSPLLTTTPSRQPQPSIRTSCPNNSKAEISQCACRQQKHTNLSNLAWQQVLEWTKPIVIAPKCFNSNSIKHRLTLPITRLSTILEAMRVSWERSGCLRHKCITFIRRKESKLLSSKHRKTI